MAPYDPFGNPISEQTDAPGGAPPPTEYSHAVWPPQPAYALPNAEEDNSSGTYTTIPDEIAVLKWNWGAFFFPFLWSVNHGMIVLGLVGLILGVCYSFQHIYGGIALVTYGVCLALKGNEMAWRKRRFVGGLPQFFEIQRVWMRCGFLLTALVVSFTGLMIFIGMRQLAYNRSYYQHYYQKNSQFLELRSHKSTARRGTPTRRVSSIESLRFQSLQNPLLMTALRILCEPKLEDRSHQPIS